MGILPVILIAVFLFGLAGSAAMWFLLRARTATGSEKPARGTVPSAAPSASAEGAVFRWRYIALPVALLVVSAAMVGYFYRLLPAEVAYRFQADGSPDEWLGRSAIVLWTLLPQFLLTLLAGAATWGISRLASAYAQAAPLGLSLDRVLFAMGNMVAILQLILFFAMLDIFSYNSYQVHILPLWALALIVMAVGAIALGVFFYRTVRQT